MPATIAYCHVPLPIHIMPHQVPDLQNVIQGVVARIKPLFDAAGIDTKVFHGHEPDGSTNNRSPRLLYQLSSTETSGPLKEVSLLGIGEGAQALAFLFEHFPQSVIWNGQENMFRPQRKPTVTMEVLDTDKGPLKEYAIIEWLALSNQAKGGQPGLYDQYLDATTCVQRVTMLESILLRQLQGLLRSFDIDASGAPRLSITEITGITHNEIVLYGHTRYSFNLTFSTNLQIPPLLSVGNTVSRGFGKVQPLKMSEKRIERLARLSREWQ